ncbi:glycosyltransferase family 9 protein [Vibrio paracholerae]|uniref:glycosyltransferase family 9 protein n=1 Tax=Vibrio paracholerae TaxID=650003 RepID=UPI001B39B71C|nr:glycosyltransferase family 9 protein [Vibrio paracholerae]MBP8550980.1 hypothetical protein [Vibrio paracholerae]
MMKTFKNLNRIFRNIRKRIKLNYYCRHYDKSPTPRIKLQEVHSIALLRWDNKLGDTIMSGIFINALKTARPDIEISVITPEFCSHWYKKSTQCHIVTCDKRSIKTARSFRNLKGKFDVVIELGSSFDFKELLAIHELGAQYNIGYNKELHPIFNICLPKEALHFKDRYLTAAKLFSDKVSEPSIPLIPFSNQNILISKDKVNVALNLFGSSKYRQFSKTEAIKFIIRWLKDFPNDVLYLIPVPDKISFLQNLLKECNSERVILLTESASLEFSLQLLSQVDLCVTPDTSVVHMASALNTPTLAIYADDHQNYQEWHPLSKQSQVLFNHPAHDKNDRIYVHEFHWSDLKAKREAMIFK